MVLQALSIVRMGYSAKRSAKNLIFRALETAAKCEPVSVVKALADKLSSEAM
jgi:hypothetical protein